MSQQPSTPPKLRIASPAFRVLALSVVFLQRFAQAGRRGNARVYS